MDDLTTRIAENAANIGMVAMSLLKNNDIEVASQINLAQDIAIKAQEFEQQYRDLDWNETGDYPEAIDAYAEKWLTDTYGAEPHAAVPPKTPGKIHVATVLVKGNGLEAVFGPLGHALAPLGFYILPFVQEAAWLNASRYDGKMTQLQFVDLLMHYFPTTSFGLSVQAEDGGRIERIKVYATEEAYWRSVYAHPDFLTHVWNSGLPVRF